MRRKRLELRKKSIFEEEEQRRQIREELQNDQYCGVTEIELMKDVLSALQGVESDTIEWKAMPWEGAEDVYCYRFMLK